MLGVDGYLGLAVALEKLIELLAAEFGASLHAVWVGGSLAWGHFDGRQSDIDVAAVLSPRPTWRRLAPRLSTLHEGLVE